MSFLSKIFGCKCKKCCEHKEDCDCCRDKASCCGGSKPAEAPKAEQAPASQNPQV